MHALVAVERAGDDRHARRVRGLLDGADEHGDHERAREVVGEHVADEADAVDDRERDEQASGAHPVGEPAAGERREHARRARRAEHDRDLVRGESHDEREVQHRDGEEDAAAHPADERRDHEDAQHRVGDGCREPAQEATARAGRRPELGLDDGDGVGVG